MFPVSSTFFMLITRKRSDIGKTVSNIPPIRKIMSKMVGIGDPVCLDLPELGPCRPESLASSVHEAEGVFGRRPPFAPCLSLAAILHGAVALLALSMGLGMPAPQSVVSISLLPPVRSAAPASMRGLSAEGATDVPHAAAVSAPVAPKVAHDSARKARASESRRVKAPAAAVQAATEKAVVPASAAPQAGSSAAASLDNAGTRTASGPADAGRSQRPGEPGQNTVNPGPGGVSGSGSAEVSGASAAGGVGAAVGPVGASFGDADGPKFVQRVMPHYPERARRKGREGHVLLRLVIGPGGELRDARVVEGGGHGFDEAALAAVRASLFAPAMRHGRAVECAALLPVRFVLKGS